MPGIFFSYSRVDTAFALKLARDLRSFGTPLWIDQLDIPPGALWDRAVEEALQESQSLLVILSPESVASENVMDEVSFALGQKRRIFPIIYRACEVPFRLRRLQYIDFTGDYNHALSQLLKAFGASAVLSPQTPKTQQYWKQGAIAIAGGLALVVVGGLAVPILTADFEQALKPGEAFSDCGGCPDVVVVPAGEFIMGSPANEKGRMPDEGPQHKVVLANALAVSKFEITFFDWEVCVADGVCRPRVDDNGWGGGRQPIINVTWEDAKRYVAWLSRRSGKPYRLLSEAEWEYAARGGAQTAYSWGDEVGQDNANCGGCGSLWDKKQAAEVGQFAANSFGLHDFHGNVWEWVEDCWHNNYEGAPTDGSAWTDNCRNDPAKAGSGDLPRMIRGGGWNDDLVGARAAFRAAIPPDLRSEILGFRVGRSLTP